MKYRGTNIVVKEGDEVICRISHFNCNKHEVGKKYIITKIHMPGYVSTNACNSFHTIDEFHPLNNGVIIWSGLTSKKPLT